MEQDQRRTSSEDKVSEGSLGQNEERHGIAIQKEEEVDNAYTLLGSKFTSLWNTASRNAESLQEKMTRGSAGQSILNHFSSVQKGLVTFSPSSDRHAKSDSDSTDNSNANAIIDIHSVSDHANKALDDLDVQLEKVEKKAGELVTLLTSFFSKTPATIKKDEESSRGNMGNSNPSELGYGSSRFDSELFKLHTRKDVYLTELTSEAAELEDFNLAERTQLIEELLKKYPDTLKVTFETLVPTDVLFELFWLRYFHEESEIKRHESIRKQILHETPLKKPSELKRADEENSEEEDEGFAWDDDEEEETDEASFQE